MGKYYEEFTIGEEFVSSGRTVTETDVMLFSGISGDYNPLHTDYEFGKTTQFGECIAHGLLGLSIATGLMARLGLFDGTAIAFLGLEEWSFTKPIFFGDTIHVKLKISEKRETKKPDRGIIYREVLLINQKNEVVQKGMMPIMIKRQPIA